MNPETLLGNKPLGRTSLDSTRLVPVTIDARIETVDFFEALAARGYTAKHVNGTLLITETAGKRAERERRQQLEVDAYLARIAKQINDAARYHRGPMAEAARESFLDRGYEP